LEAWEYFFGFGGYELIEIISQGLEFMQLFIFLPIAPQAFAYCPFGFELMSFEL
jgi:hypothetical protein